MAPHSHPLITTITSSAETLIILQGWSPRGLCSTSSEELLVTMISDSGSTENQSTQMDKKGSGIITDSLGNIQTSDYINDCIHIIDQDGHFLRYIHKFEWVNLCVDSRDNLFVAKLFTVKVKKI
ncbi:uncharacterized protein LOC144625059 [Crassostrea virginica]